MPISHSNLVAKPGPALDLSPIPRPVIHNMIIILLTFFKKKKKTKMDTRRTAKKFCRIPASCPGCHSVFCFSKVKSFLYVVRGSIVLSLRYVWVEGFN